MKTSLVIPVFNEKQNIEPLYQQVCDALTPLGMDYEIIFVDDGSADGTTAALENLATRDERVRPLRLCKNSGQTIAMQVGIRNSRGTVIVTLDGDLQNDPQDIPMMLSRLAEGYDLVVGWRKNRQDRMLTRKIPSLIANWIISRFLGARVHDLGCSLKVYRAELIQRIPLYSDLHRFIPIVSSLASTRISEVEVRHRPRQHGRSKYGISRTGRVILDVLTLRMLLLCAQRPLRWFGMGAIPILMLAFGVGTWALYTLVAHGVSTYVLPGATVLLGYLGLHLFFAGMLGELVVRAEPRARVTPLVDTIRYPVSD